MKDYKVKINGKEYPIRMRMFAIREYKRITGKNLVGDNSLTDVFGSKVEVKEFNADLFISLLYSMLKDGAYPQELGLTIDDLAASVNNYDYAEIGNALSFLYIRDRYGLTDEQVEETFKVIEKNVTAPEDGAKT
jgi:hypothetical protein